MEETTVRFLERTLMGPGPSNIDPRVYAAMTRPIMGHLDPEFIKVMDEIMVLLRKVFQTKNRLTFPVSATGSGGMEAALANVIEPGDRVVILINGVFGERMADIARRYGAEVEVLEIEWGKVFNPEEVKSFLSKHAPVKVVGIVHAETSTGALQPLEEISRVVHDYNSLFLVDTVTSLGGTEVLLDKWGIDIAYSGTQKCLSCPPGLAPISFSERAVETMKQRKTPVVSWYFDVNMLRRYWETGERFYHHTAPITMNYALWEALRIIEEEGLEARFERHSKLSAILQDALEALGLELLVEKPYRAPMITSVIIPDGVSDSDIRGKLLTQYSIEIGGGLRDLKGRIWRIGLMGYSCQKKNISLLIGALGQCLNECGYKADIKAAFSVLDEEGINVRL